MPKFELDIGGNKYEVEAPDESSLPEIADEIASREGLSATTAPAQEEAPAVVAPKPEVDLETKYKNQETGKQRAEQQAASQAAAAQAQEDDPANWTLEKTKKHYKDNPPKNIEEEAKANVVIKAKEAALKMAIENIKNVPMAGGFSLNQLEQGQKAIEAVVERPVAGLRGVAKEGPEGFVKGLKDPGKYPPGTFGEALVGAGMDPTAAGALGTLADAGYYFGVPEAMTRVITAGKVKLLEGTLNNVFKALAESGRKPNAIPTIDADALHNAAQDKDIFNIVKSYLKSKDVKFARVPGQQIEAPVVEAASKSPEIADQAVTTLYRGGPEGVPPKGKTALDVLNYEKAELGNKDIKTILPTNELDKIKSEDTRWFTTTEEAAKEYGEVSKVTIGDHRIIAEDGQGGVLIELSSKKEMPQLGKADEEIGNKIVNLSKEEYTPYEKKSITIGPAEPKTIEVIKNSLGLDATQFVHSVDNYGLRHALNEHSKDEIPLTENDFKLIPDIIKNPDSVEYSGRSKIGRDTLRYKKRYNGSTFYVEEVRTGRKTLSIQTMYKIKVRPLSDEGLKASAPLPLTSASEEAPASGLAATSNIPQKQGQVKVSQRKTLTGEIVARGGLDPEKLSKDYNIKELREFGVGHIFKKGGQGLDDIAGQLQSEGIIQVPENINPSDYLIEQLKSKEDRKLSSSEPTQSELKQFEEKSAQKAEAQRTQDKELGIDFVPEEYENEGKIRKFITTVKEADKTAPEVKAQIESRYTPITNQETLVEAQKFVLESYNEALRTAMSNDTPTAFTNATAQVLIDKAQGEGRWEEARELIERTSERNTSLGQAIQALAMYERLTPEGILRYAESVIKKAREARPAAQVKQFLEAIKKQKDPESIAKLARQMKIPYLDEATMKDLYEHAKRLETMEPGRDKSIEMALLLKKIASQIPRSGWAKVSMIQTMAQLLNPKTAIRNILGNAGFMISENISDTVGTVLDIATSMATGKRTRYLPNIEAQIKGLKKGWGEGYEEAKLGIDLSGQTSKFSLPRNSIFDQGVLSALEKTMMVTLKAPDRAFYQAAFNQSLENQMRAVGTKDPSIEMIEQAHLDGLYRTFQDDSVISRAFVTLKKGLNEITGKEWGLGDMVIKYPKTPANILSRGIEYSPFNAANSIWQFVKFLKSNGRNQREFVNTTSRTLAGTTLMVGVGALLSSMGIITGKAEKDRDVQGLQKQVGLGEYRINISALQRFVMSGFNPAAAKRLKEDTLVSYDWFQPQSINIAMGANIAKSAMEGDKDLVTFILESSGKLLDVASAAGQTIIDQPLMKGLRSITSKQDLIESVQDIVKGMPASFVPTFLSQIRQLTDNISRNTKDPNYFKEAYNKVMNKVPGMSYMLSPNINTFGKKQRIYQNDTNNPFNVFLNPAFVSKYQPTKEARMVLKIWEQTGETKHFPRVAKNQVIIEGQKIELHGKKYLEYQKYIGNKTGVLYQLLANDDTFKSLPNEEKSKQLSKYLTDINTAAKIEILGYRPQRVNTDVITIIKDLGRFYKAKQ